MLSTIKSKLHSALHRVGYDVIALYKDRGSGTLLPGHLKKVFERLSINCVLDVGASYGQYAFMLRSMGYQGNIISFEPLRDIYRQLEHHASSDNFWRVFNFALGEQDEFRDFNIIGEHYLSSFLKPNRNITIMPNSEVERVEPVMVKQLDSILDDVIKDIPEPRVFLKMDTQGYDLNVVKGAAHSISKILGIQTELSIIPIYEGMPDYLEALAYYGQLGFTPTGLFSVHADGKTGHLYEFDAVLTRR